MAVAKAHIFPICLSERDVSSSFLGSSPRAWRFFFACPCHARIRRRPSLTTAVYTEGVSTTRSVQRREMVEPESDVITMLNERIRREQSKRDVSKGPAMDSEEAEKYIQLVKEQQRRGLQKLKGERAGKENGEFSYKADPYTLRSGDYVVHKKVGVGRFIGIKLDIPKDSSNPIEYVFIEYADGMAKLPVNQASRMLYRYNL